MRSGVPAPGGDVSELSTWMGCWFWGVRLHVWGGVSDWRWSVLDIFCL